jgi:hypothetical protein
MKEGEGGGEGHEANTYNFATEAYNHSLQELG